MYPIKNKKECLDEFLSSLAFYGHSTIIHIESCNCDHAHFSVLHTAKINKSRDFFGPFFSVKKTHVFRQFRGNNTVKKSAKK